ncbi:Uncharacterised protein [Yersinia frederiksenii]|jgi:hypothetical protein|nr:Uncharacterised protein [Yersinia frederiksenii]CQR26222.1 Uncharacterised protein [Yersinia enterocolitica]CNF93847.1 Uncharacterised protein [Yersinia frederiksenii]CNL35237.1 Uncharacterised protein [Yersinia frederiksenii]CQH50958.1 Uncharacterised protein [Yersinia frederiksenii]
MLSLLVLVATCSRAGLFNSNQGQQQKIRRKCALFFCVLSALAA